MWRSQHFCIPDTKYKKSDNIYVFIFIFCKKKIEIDF